jgi:dimeric dUTPase (all-alpha-NTP-PPase superfamily)
MNFKRLFELQKELDYRILDQHDLRDKPLLQKKVLALQVELGELANETRCFKYWSEKKPSDVDTILEEYVDCLHFILSIGIEKDFTDVNLDVKHVDYPLTDHFLNLYIDVNDFVICSSKDQYLTLFEDFLSLGLSLGFNKEQIQDAYLKKNLTNHERQNTGY